MKRISHELTYPGTTIGQGASRIGYPTFRGAVAYHQGVVRRSVSVSGEMPARRIEVELVHGTDRVPGFAKKFVGDEIPIVQVETWSSLTEADAHVTIPGQPGDMKGTARSTQPRDDDVATTDRRQTVKIQTVGGELERNDRERG